jgi:membrane protein implicated in regulation of membrane protease activity
MEKLELQKRLEKKRAYMICLIVLLGIITPTVFSMSVEYNLSFSIQVSLFLGILVAMLYVFKKMRKVKTQLNSLV